MSILRNAIVYIQSLQQLLVDCDSGLMENLQTIKHQPDKSEKKIINVQNNFPSKIKNIKKVILDPKWTHYSQQFLQNKFSKDDYLPTDNCDEKSESSSLNGSLDAELPELSSISLPNIEDLLSTNIIDSNSDNVVTLQFQLIKESKVLGPPSPSINTLDVTEYFQCIT